MVNRLESTTLHRSLLAKLLVAAFFFFVAVTPLFAGPHHARVSADLADHLTAGSQNIDVIVHGEKAEVDALSARYNVQIKRYLKSGAVLHVTAGQLAALRDDDTVDHLSGDIRIQSTVDAATAESIGADQVWAGTDRLAPLTGQGVSVAVIDSGIDTRHNSLRKRVLAMHDFTGGDGMDRYGHGTHVAGIIAGQVGETDDTREYRGIASGAYLINLRVLGDDGSGTASGVIEAIDWAIEHKREYNIRVINLSLGAPVLQPYRDDPLCEAVERAVQAGITVVAAAGNYGRSLDGRTVLGSIMSPGNSPHAITVAAIDTHGTPERSDDTLAAYSSRGPTRYDLILKPDVAAPGSHILSAESTDSYLSRTYPERHVAGSGPNAYMQLSGTSMAAGVVSGAVALLLDARSSLSPRESRAALQLTSTFLASAGLIGAGAGIINVAAAAEFIQGLPYSNATLVSGETIRPSGIAFTADQTTPVRTQVPRDASTYWANTIYWGTAAGPETVYLGNTYGTQTIYWGTAAGAQTIYWGTSVGAQTIYWGTSVGAQTIYWGTSVGAQTIYWGTSVGAETIYWGTSVAAETIYWGTSAADSLF